MDSLDRIVARLSQPKYKVLRKTSDPLIEWRSCRIFLDHVPEGVGKGFVAESSLQVGPYQYADTYLRTGTELTKSFKSSRFMASILIFSLGNLSSARVGMACEHESEL